MSNFLDNFQDLVVPYPRKVAGYSCSEIEKLEGFFDFSIGGNLRDFFKNVGRCFGGIIGDNSLIMYRDNWSFERHKQYQFGMREDLIEEGFGEYFGKGEFFFSRESDGCYDYFVRTRSSTPDLVYVYDGETVRKTNSDFNAHVFQIVKDELDYLEKIQDVKSEEYQQVLKLKHVYPEYFWSHITGKNPLVFRGNMLP